MERTEENVESIKRWFQEVWNERREETIDEIFARDGVAHGLGDVGIDFDQFKAMWRTFSETFEDLHCEHLLSFGSGEYTTSHYRITGRHVGPGLGVPPTGKEVRFEGQSIGRWSEGMLVEAWNTIDLVTVYRQIGALTASP